jgi:hypothetical protein
MFGQGKNVWPVSFWRALACVLNTFLIFTMPRGDRKNKRRDVNWTGHAAERCVRHCPGLSEREEVVFLRLTSFSEADSRLAAWTAMTKNFVRGMAYCSRCGIVQFGDGTG